MTLTYPAGLKASTRISNIGDWQGRHDTAVAFPAPGFERSMVGMLSAWAIYADTHKRQYESSIGQDGVLGDNWADIGKGLLGLLNGQIGRLTAARWIISSVPH